MIHGRGRHVTLGPSPAKTLLADAVVTAEHVQACQDRVTCPFTVVVSPLQGVYNRAP